MKSLRESLLLYAVTDRSWSGESSLEKQIDSALRGGITMTQLREKDISGEEFLAEALRVGALCKRYGVPLIINDDADTAVNSGADGVHIGQSDMKVKEARKAIGAGKILGVSAQTVRQAVAAERDGADYLGVGAVFPTSTKSDAEIVSLGTLREICAAVSIPVVAIGGIMKSNVRDLAGSGIAGIAVVSAIFAQSDTESCARELLDLAEGYFR